MILFSDDSREDRFSPGLPNLLGLGSYQVQFLSSIVNLGLAVGENDHHPPRSSPPEVPDHAFRLHVLCNDREFPVIGRGQEEVGEDLFPHPVGRVAEHEGKVAQLLAVKELSYDAFLAPTRWVRSPHLIGTNESSPARECNPADSRGWKFSRQRLQARSTEDKTVLRILAHVVNASSKRLILLLESPNLADEALKPERAGAGNKT